MRRHFAPAGGSTLMLLVGACSPRVASGPGFRSQGRFASSRSISGAGKSALTDNGATSRTARYDLVADVDNDGDDDFVPPSDSSEALPPSHHSDELGVMRKSGDAVRLTRLRNAMPVPDAAGGEEGTATGADDDAAEDAAELLMRELELDADPDVAVAADADHADAMHRLGYDDAEYAERVLQMEADGAMDEAWQEQPTASKEDVATLCEILRDLKVDDVCAICTTEKTSSWDYMIFGTCTGARHIAVAAWAVSEADKHERMAKPARRKTDDEWDAIPCGRIVVNLLTHSKRESLNLERKWVLTENTDPTSIARSAVSEGRGVRMHGLWTLTVNLQDLEDYEVDYCKDALLRQL